MDLQPVIDAVRGTTTVRLRDGREVIVAPDGYQVQVPVREPDTIISMKVAADAA
ncbi:MAG: hypothetical protein AAFW60_02890 [Pseudomonadota bacterium]